MSGKQRLRSDGSDVPTSKKKRKTGHENEKASNEPNSPGGGAEATPAKDRRPWTHEEEIALVQVLLEHRKEGRILPLQSKSAPYWTDVIAQLYPGQKGITQRRIYDKVRRMQGRYTESSQLLQEGSTPWRNMHEKALLDFWEKIFADEENTNKSENKSVQETEKKRGKVSNGNSVNVVQVSDSSSSEEEDDHQEQRALIAKVIPNARLPPQESSGSDEEEDDEDDDEEDDSSPEKRRPAPSGQNGARAEATRFVQEERRKRDSLPRDDNPKTASKLGFRQVGGSEKEKFARKEQWHHLENGEKRPAEQARLEADMVRSLKAELFEYVNNLRNDCMREVDEVRNQLINPARLQSSRRRQELILEELSLREKELEISRRYCRLQKEALKLQNAS